MKNLLALITASALASSASAAVITGYNFTTNLAPTSASPTGISGATNIGFGAGSTGSGATQGYTTARYNGTISGNVISGRSNSGSGGANGSVYIRGQAADGNSLATAISGGRSITAPTNGDIFSSTPDDYFGFSFTVDPGYTLDLTSLTFDAARSATAAGSPGEVRLLLSPTGFTSADSLGGGNISTFTDSGTYQGFNVSLAGNAELQNLAAGTYEARFYVYNATVALPDGSNPTRFDNIVLNGNVTPVPEPTASLMILGAAGILMSFRRRA